jgi:PAS domain S-box-containing protein
MVEDSANLDSQLQLQRMQLLIEELSARVDRLNQVIRSRAYDQSQLSAASDLLRQLNPMQRILHELKERARAQEKEREQLHALQAVGAVINSSLDLSEVLREVMDAIIELTGAERGFLMLLDEQKGELDVQVARNMDRKTIETSSFDISRSIVQSVAESGEPVVTLNAQSDPRFASQESIISYNLRSILCVPLKTKDTITGVIYADNRIASGIFGDTDRDLLAAFANQAAVAIDNARLFQQIREQLANITEMKNLMDDVFASIASGVITIDTFDRIALFNRAAEQILDVPAKKVLDKPYTRALSGMEGFADIVEQVKERGGQHNVELDTAVSRRPGMTTLNLTFSPLRDIQQETLGVAVVMNDVSETKRLESVRRYLPPGLVDQVRDLDAAQRPQRRQMSVLFADIRGFSSISEHLAPEKLIQILNGYFAVAAQAIIQFEGVIDKYMGDAIMAEFNTPLNPQANHVERAVRTALMMRDELTAYHNGLAEERRLYFGIGIHVGEAVVGNVGTHFRKDYSVVGDAVNLAKRLQEVAGPGQILLSEAAYLEVADWVDVDALEPMQVKGRQAEEQFYALNGINAS